jgi:hypothetical protein
MADTGELNEHCDIALRLRSVLWLVLWRGADDHGSHRYSLAFTISHLHLSQLNLSLVIENGTGCHAPQTGF